MVIKLSELTSAESIENTGNEDILRSPDTGLKGLLGRAQAQANVSLFDPSVVTGETKLESFKPVKEVVQLASQFTPFSPIAEFLGEGLDSLQESGVVNIDSLKTAAKKGTTAAGVDLSLRLALGGLPNLSKLGVNKKVANVLERGLIPSGAESFLKGRVQQKASKYSVKAINEITENPNILKGTKEGLDEIGERGFNAITKLRKDQGEIIGMAKSKLNIKDIPMEYDDVVVQIEPLKRRLGFIAEKGEVARRDKLGSSAIKIVEDELKQKGVRKNLKNLQRILDNIDESDEFQKIYETFGDETKRITTGQREALNLRNSIRDLVNKRADDILTEAGLGASKDKFAKIAKAMEQRLLRGGIKDPDAFTSTLKKMKSEQATGLFDSIKELDSLLPVEDRFFSDAMANIVQRDLKGVDPFSLFNLGNLGGFMRGATTSMAKGTVGGTPIVRPLLRRGLSETITNQNVGVNQ